MKKTLLSIAILVVGTIFVFFSCDKEASAPDLFQIGLEVKDVKPLKKELYFHTAKMIDAIDIIKTEPNVSESIIIEYEDFPVAAILTPLVVENSCEDISHLYFEKEGLVSTFSLLLYSGSVDENTKVYSFVSTEGLQLFSLTADVSTGIISDFEVEPFYFEKSWWRRFNNCLMSVLDQLIEEPVVGLICMAWGKICAPSIAALCAIAATEGYFEEPGQP